MHVVPAVASPAVAEVAGVEVRADGRVMSFFADFTYEASRGIIDPCRQPTRTVTRGVGNLIAA
jgi:hypothetical protein